jgi:hypothetical protein
MTLDFCCPSLVIWTELVTFGGGSGGRVKNISAIRARRAHAPRPAFRQGRAGAAATLAMPGFVPDTARDVV